jgi:hypothetical protein
MRQTFSVTVPAPDLSLLTIEQLRVAAGLSWNDDCRDPELEELGKRVAADIAAACGVAFDGINPPTLRSETVSETFWNGCRESEMILSRRFISAVTTVTEQGTVLVSDDFVIDRDAGLLSRVSSGRPWSWYVGSLAVVYVAGFAVVPADLAGAAMDLARFRLSEGGTDPLEKGRTVEIPDVETVRVDRWVGAVPGTATGGMPSSILAKLSRFMNMAVA